MSGGKKNAFCAVSFRGISEMQNVLIRKSGRFFGHQGCESRPISTLHFMTVTVLTVMIHQDLLLAEENMG